MGLFSRKEPDYTNPAEAARVRQELAKLDAFQRKDEQSVGGIWPRDKAAYDRKRAKLQDQLDWATCSGKYKR
ncbi:hypothetical protein [Nocardiopsis sp. FIRDI 009]|uniref:hypothetical protein n=1 Tax=Nocardiopsis sp. FIRDI 009 TaxID=714197 RepID=UPI000E23C3AE|nr:hypothetical protein [Nocardiopsis sp. FIRDI 009]